MNYIKRLIRSKTIKGIIAAAIGGIVGQIPLLLTPEILAQYGPALQGVAALLQAGGLSFATYGRIKATSPLTPPPDSITRGQASPPRGEGDDFDGTGTER